MLRYRSSGKKTRQFQYAKKVKEAAGIFKVSNNGRLYDKNNQITVDKLKKIETWKKLY